MKTSKNILYLYTEVMPYAIAVMRALVKDFGATVDCIYWDEKKRTPFVPTNESGIFFHKRSAFDKALLLKFIEEKHPLVVYVSGRMDKLYLDAVLKFKNSSIIVTGCDNQWDGTLRQRLGSVLSYQFYRKYFEYIWVPGPRQYEFARNLKYPKNKIIYNFLPGDTNIFSAAYNDNTKHKTDNFPHTFVYAGRLVQYKGIDLLIDSFIKCKKELPNDWKLVLIGAGDYATVSHPDIEVKSFMSGEELANDCKNFGVFCLPSHREPWGVVIHEFCMAGLPIIASDRVGASDSFIVQNYNGFIYPHNSGEELKNSLLKVITKSDEELMIMGERSHEISKRYSPQIAAYSLMSVVNNTCLFQ